MRFLATVCRCGFNLAIAEPDKVLYRGKGKDKEPYAECPAGCGRTYLLTDEEAPGTPPAEPEPAEPSEPAEPPAEPTQPEQ